MSFQPCTIPETETERLFLRGWRNLGLEIFADIFANEEAPRYIGEVKPPKEFMERFS
jgi:hypothetical protein